MIINDGDVFSIKTKIGIAFLQYISKNELGIELVRVLEPIKQTSQITQDEINLKERYSIHFVLRAAIRKKIIERVGEFKIPIDY